MPGGPAIRDLNLLALARLREAQDSAEAAINLLQFAIRQGSCAPPNEVARAPNAATFSAQHLTVAVLRAVGSSKDETAFLAELLTVEAPMAEPLLAFALGALSSVVCFSLFFMFVEWLLGDG